MDPGELTEIRSALVCNNMFPIYPSIYQSIYLFIQAAGMDPGELTEIRSALVCNNMFAGLLVDKGLQGNILYSAPAIRAKIGDYVSNR